MAKVTPLLWKHKKNADGHHPIYLRFADSHRTLYAALGVYVHPRFWNGRAREVRKGHPHSERINALIAKRQAQAEDARLQLLHDDEPVTAEALKAAVAPTASQAPACFLRHARALLDEVERRGNVGRARKERAVLNKLEAFAGTKGSPLPFGRITAEFLRSYETHLIEKHGNKASTVRSNMSIIRTHFRRAIKEGVVPREADPFFAYSPPRAERAHRHKLSVKELAAIESLDLGGPGPVSPLIARVRDAFLFALYGAGIRFADVARLKCGDLREEVEGKRTHLRLAYRMGKTKKRVDLRLIPKAERIARAYLLDEDGEPRAPEAFLFPMLDGYDIGTAKDLHNAVSAQNTIHNKYLKKIAKQAKVSGSLSFHVARHSFADLARREGWDVYAISKAMAHSGLAVTEHYLAGFDSDLVDGKLNELFGGDDG